MLDLFPTATPELGAIAPSAGSRPTDPLRIAEWTQLFGEAGAQLAPPSGGVAADDGDPAVPEVAIPEWDDGAIASRAAVFVATILVQQAAPSDGEPPTPDIVAPSPEGAPTSPTVLDSSGSTPVLGESAAAGSSVDAPEIDRARPAPIAVLSSGDAIEENVLPPRPSAPPLESVDRRATHVESTPTPLAPSAPRPLSEAASPRQPSPLPVQPSEPQSPSDRSTSPAPLEVALSDRTDPPSVVETPRAGSEDGPPLRSAPASPGTPERNPRPPDTAIDASADVSRPDLLETPASPARADAPQSVNRDRVEPRGTASEATVAPATLEPPVTTELPQPQSNERAIRIAQATPVLPVHGAPTLDTEPPEATDESRPAAPDSPPDAVPLRPAPRVPQLKSETPPSEPVGGEPKRTNAREQEHGRPPGWRGFDDTRVAASEPLPVREVATRHVNAYLTALRHAGVGAEALGGKELPRLSDLGSEREVDAPPAQRVSAPVDRPAPGAAPREGTAIETGIRAETPAKQETIAPREIARPSAENAALGPIRVSLGSPTPHAPSQAGSLPEAVTRIAPSALVEALVARAREIPARGTVELRFALEPEDLGLLRVRLEARGDELRIRILAASTAAVDSLNPALQRLSTQLTDAGFRTPTIEITLDGAFDPGAQQRQTDRESNASRDRGAGAHRSEPHEIAATTTARPVSDRRLDRLA